MLLPQQPRVPRFYPRLFRLLRRRHAPCPAILNRSRAYPRRPWGSSPQTPERNHEYVMKRIAGWSPSPRLLGALPQTPKRCAEYRTKSNAGQPPSPLHVGALPPHPRLLIPSLRHAGISVNSRERNVAEVNTHSRPTRHAVRGQKKTPAREHHATAKTKAPAASEKLELRQRDLYGHRRKSELTDLTTQATG